MFSSGGSTASSISTRTICVGVATAGAVAVAAWLAWPRRAKASKEEALLALKALEEECTSVFADVAEVVHRLELPRDVFSSRRRPDDGSEDEDDVSEVLNQPLVLGSALRNAACKAAKTLADNLEAEDLDSILQGYSDEPDIKMAVANIKAMHTSCAQSAAYPQVVPLPEPWTDKAQLLETFTALGRARAARLQELKTQVASDEVMQTLGPVALRSCIEAEDEFWSKSFPGDNQRRRTFASALQSLSRADPAFHKNRKSPSFN